MGGTAPAYVLNFTIPKGDKGDKGDTGAAGSSGGSSGSTYSNYIYAEDYGAVGDGSTDDTTSISRSHICTT